MKTSGLIVTLCALVLSASAPAQTPPTNTGQALTQEYATLYREYLDKKKLGLDAEAQTKYGEFLTAFRKHRLLAKGIVSGPSGPGGPGAPGGVPGGPPPGGGDQGGVGGHPGETGGGGGFIDPQPPGGDTGGGENEVQLPPGDGGLSPTSPSQDGAPVASAPPPSDGGTNPDSGPQSEGNPVPVDDGGGAAHPAP